MTSPDEPFLNDKQKRKFIQDGYIILKGAIPQSNVEQALQHISKGDDEQDANLFDRDGQVPVIKSLFTDTVLSRVADDMLGTGTHRLLGKPQVAVTTKDVSALRLGMKLTDRPAPHKWHVDASRGKFSPLGADFLILFGIALSSGQEVDENRGQFIYFPGMLNGLSVFLFYRVCDADCRQ